MLALTKNQAKDKAESLNRFLKERGVSLPSSDLLNAVARMVGFEDWNAMSAGYRPNAIDAVLDDHERAHAEDSGDQQFGAECVVQVASGFWLATPAYPAEVDYVRVCDPIGREVAYWSVDEVTENAGEVIGALVGALNRRRTDLMPVPGKPTADKLVSISKAPAKQANSRLSDINWDDIFRIVEYFTLEHIGEHKLYHRCYEVADREWLLLLDAEREGTITAEQRGVLDENGDEIVIDWLENDQDNECDEKEGLSVAELRGMTQKADLSWLLHDGRRLAFCVLQPV